MAINMRKKVLICFTSSVSRCGMHKGPPLAAVRGSATYASQSRERKRARCFSGVSSDSLLRHVKDRAIRIHTGHRRIGGPVCHEVFRGNHTLRDPVRRARSMAAHPQDAFASVGIMDSKNHVPAGGLTEVADQVSRSWGKEARKLPARKRRYPIDS